MKIRFAVFAAPCVALALLNADVGAAQDLPRAFLCDKLDGFNMSAPGWRPQPDGYGNTKFLLSYRPGNELSRVTSFKNGEKVYEAEGFGVVTNAGFSIAIFGGEYLETYVVNVGTSEVLHTATRAGSAVLPNAVKSMRGFCVPAGNLVR